MESMNNQTSNLGNPYLPAQFQQGHYPQQPVAQPGYTSTNPIQGNPVTGQVGVPLPSPNVRPLEIMPAIVSKEELPSLPPEQISGILRQGGKMVVSGGSKTGKSFLMIELGISIATGTPWCGFQCTQGRALLVNLEIGKAQFNHRVADVAKALGLDKETIKKNLDTVSLRGKIGSIDDLTKSLIASCTGKNYSMIIIDPMYKVQSGHENEARSITDFCSKLDVIANTLNCSIAYCHHHSKGSQGAKASEDRASGSGVIARDADALIDMMELDSKFDDIDAIGIPFRLEFVLRDFKEPSPLNLRFLFPIHKVSLESDLLTRNYADTRSGHRKRTAPNKLDYFERKCDEFMGDKSSISRKELADYLGVDKRTLTNNLAKSEKFKIESGSNDCTVFRVDANVGESS